MKKLSLLLLLSLLYVLSFGQTEITIKNLTADADGWIQLQASAQYSMAVKPVNCNGVSSFLLRLENKSGDDMTIKWHHRKSGEAAAEPAAFQTIILEKNSLKQGVCPAAESMTIRQPLVTYLYDGLTVQDLIFTLLIN
ncbi:MAG: hypothetical protein IBJ16_03045 [Chitinophagaceae bacterium]|nr:hypothetical protein [Chitinophagaceae bacterium]